MTMPLVDLAMSGFILCSNYARTESLKSLKTFARAQSSGMPLKELSRVKLRRLTRERILKNSRKTGTRQNTRAVLSTFAKMHSRYKPCFIDALFVACENSRLTSGGFQRKPPDVRRLFSQATLFGVTGISG